MTKVPPADREKGNLDTSPLSTTSRAQFRVEHDVSFVELMATLAPRPSPPLREDEEWGNQLEED